MRDRRIFDENLSYFLTSTTVDWIPLFTRPTYKDIIIDSLNYCVANKGLIVYAWVLMTDHLNLLAKSQEGIKLSGVMRDFKRFTAVTLHKQIQQKTESRKYWMNWICDQHKFYHKKNQQFQIWQPGNYAIPITENKDFDIKLNYIHQNPVKQKHVKNPEDWIYSSATDYAGGKGPVVIEKINFFEY